MTFCRCGSKGVLLILLALSSNRVDAQSSETRALPLSAPDPSRADSDVDCDGLSDREERDRVYSGERSTDPTLWDSDLDGLADGLELGRTGSVDPACPDVVLDGDPTTVTSPVNADTDADGLADGYEDRDADGVIDAHETDPRASDHGARPHLPEPLLYDLVRGLGARRGELEANVLVVFAPDVHLAPELEWAFADGFAAELELPMHGTRLEAVKVALQGTLRRRTDGRFRHGWQVIGELGMHGAAHRLAATHVSSGPFGRRGSLVWMAGASAENVTQGPVLGSLIANVSLFLTLDEQTRVGLETTSRTPLRRSPIPHVALVPQVHVDLSRHARVQAGLGVELAGLRAKVLGASRIVVEF